MIFGLFQRRDPNAAIVDSLKPHAGDVVIEGKRGLCGFESTNLDWVLRSRGITDIALGGFLTNCCVESTMRVGYEKGYNVVTLTDCTAALSWEEQEHACAKNYPMFSRPLTHTEWLAELTGGAQKPMLARQRLASIFDCRRGIFIARPSMRWNRLRRAS